MTLPRDHWRVNCNSTAQRAVSGPPATCSWSTKSNTCLWKAHLSTKISNRLKATSKEWVYFPNSGTSDLLCLPYGDWAGWGRYRTRVHDSSCVWSWVAFAGCIPDPTWLPWQVWYEWDAPVIGDNETFQCLSVTEQLVSSNEWQLLS